MRYFIFQLSLSSNIYLLYTAPKADIVFFVSITFIILLSLVLDNKAITYFTSYILRTVGEQTRVGEHYDGAQKYIHPVYVA